MAHIYYFHSLFTLISVIGKAYKFPTTISRCKKGANHSYLRCKLKLCQSHFKPVLHLSSWKLVEWKEGGIKVVYNKCKLMSLSFALIFNETYESAWIFLCLFYTSFKHKLVVGSCSFSKDVHARFKRGVNW